MIMKNKVVKKIAFITGTRADFGLMLPVLKALENRGFKLQIYVTGMHLMPKFGSSVKLVKKYFPGCKTINSVFKEDNRFFLALFCHDFIKKLTEELRRKPVDLVLILGDRPEALSTALACLYLGVPVGHLHGGDVTLTIDGVARHAITKLASLHFAATKKSALRIKKMGEEGWRVHLVGAPGLDAVKNYKLPGRQELFKKLGVKYFPGEFILFLQHPYYEGGKSINEQIKESLEAVKSIKIPVIAVYPNADPGGRKIINIIDREKNNPCFHIFPNIEYKYFLALEKEAAVIVGNSSSAVIEAASFRTPVVTVGLRESDREKGKNVISVGYDRRSIKKAIEKSLYDRKYLNSLKNLKNPWGDGRASERIIKVIKNLSLGEKLINKRLDYDF